MEKYRFTKYNCFDINVFTFHVLFEKLALILHSYLYVCLRINVCLNVCEGESNDPY